MSWNWISQNFDALPRRDDLFFKLLWEQRRLQFVDSSQEPDALDEINASLVCAALEKRQRIFVTLPDGCTRRPALLFSTGLIMSALDRLRKAEEAKLTPAILSKGCESDDDMPACRVLYFGSAVGIREQLGQVSVNGGMKLNLADAFQPETTIRGHPERTRSVKKSGRHKHQESSGVTLPKVLCIYAPADPIAVLSQYPPAWIAIDCGDESQIRWLPPIMRYAAENDIPIIAWGQNPLSQCLAEFADTGKVFPTAIPSFSPFPTRDHIRQNSMLAFESNIATDMEIRILEDSHANHFSKLLHEAEVLLSRCTRLATGPLVKDAIRLHWSYLRSVETLSVPLAFYEAEATRFYGMSPISHWKAACDKFQAAIGSTDSECNMLLEQCTDILDVALDYLQTSDPPLWTFLVSACKEKRLDTLPRFVIFPSIARKRLFVLAMVARHNLTEGDLNSDQTWIFDLNEFRRESRLADMPLLKWSGDGTPLCGHPLLVGLPSPFTTPKLLPVLMYESATVLIYPHQRSPAERRIREWNHALRSNMASAVSVLSCLNEVLTPSEIKGVKDRVYSSLSFASILQANSSKSLAKRATFLPIEDPAEEISRLFAVEEDDQNGLLNISPYEDNIEGNDIPFDGIWCDQVVEVQFDQGWRAFFSSGDIINVITNTSSGQQIEERFVRSLEINNRVVLVHGQRRQSLYDLIISRVHQHPSIELHLALTRRWREDFVGAYRKWRCHGVRNEEVLLQQLRLRGSKITSSLTVHLWLKGETLCPLDANDLLRLAEILDLGFVRSHHKSIYQAANRIRGLHRTTANRLNRWLEQQSRGAVTESDNEIIDPALGLTFGDFRNSLMILRVMSAQTIDGPFLVSSLGMIERVDADVE